MDSILDKTSDSIHVIIEWDNLKNVTYTDRDVHIEYKIPPRINGVNVAITTLFREVTQMKKQMSQMLDTIRDLQDENNLLKDYVSLLELVSNATCQSPIGLLPSAEGKRKTESFPSKSAEKK